MSNFQLLATGNSIGNIFKSIRKYWYLDEADELYVNKDTNEVYVNNIRKQFSMGAKLHTPVVIKYKDGFKFGFYINVMGDKNETVAKRN